MPFFFLEEQNSVFFTDHLCLHGQEQDQVHSLLTSSSTYLNSAWTAGPLRGGHHAMCAHSCRCCVHLEQRRLCGQEEKER